MASTPTTHRGARFIAWAGFALGSLVSVAGNWLHAWLPADEHVAGWSPSLASQIGAAVWPVALLLAVEVLSRTPWLSGKAWMLVRFGGAAVVALGSAIISYGHIHAVLTSWGYDKLGAGVGPLVIDGLMVISGFALLAMSQHAAAPTADAGGQEVEAREAPARTKRERRRPPTLPVARQEPPEAPAPPAPQEADSRQEPSTPLAGREASAVAVDTDREGAGWEVLAAALPKGAPAEDVWEAIRAYREETGSLPSTNLVKTRMGVGTSRAERLLRDVDTPTALRAVREATA